MSTVKNLLFLLFAFLATLFLAPDGVLPPHDVHFGVLEHKRVALEGALAPNRKLDLVERLTTEVEGTTLGILKGPESIAVRGDHLYTGLIGGDIVSLDLTKPGASWQKVYKHGHSCAGQHQEEVCGRPLGLHVDHQDRLLVADAIHGVYRVDLANGTAEELTGPAMANSVTEGDDGVVYYTVFSARHTLSEGVLEMLALGGTPSGRLEKYDPATKVSTVLVDGLAFANGLALSADGKFLVVSDLGRGRLLRYRLDTGKTTTFAEMPGLADNVRKSPKGFLVGIVTPAIADRADASDTLFGLTMRYPMLARFCYRVLNFLRSVVGLVNSSAPSEHLDKLYYWMTNFETFRGSSTLGYGLVVEYGEEGEVLRSWHSPEGKVAGISEASPSGDFLYLGSPWNDFVGRVKYEDEED